MEGHGAWGLGEGLWDGGVEDGEAGWGVGCYVAGLGSDCGRGVIVLFGGLLLEYVR